LSARVDRVRVKGGPGYRFARALVRVILRAGWRLRVLGLEHLPDPPYILAANHSSEIDPLVLGASVPDHVVYLASRHLEQLPIVFRLVRAFDPVFVRRGLADIAGIRATLARLARGEVVAIYPEGRVIQDAPLGPLHEGLAFVALRAAAPIVPVAIFGASQMWPLGARRARLSRLTVKIGVPLVPRGGEDARMLTARLRDALLGLLADEPRRAQSL
jgi:1-acyl-sn-glycerol-3-phosphate acyltransferase